MIQLMILLICLGPILTILFKIFNIPYDKNCLGCGMVGFCGDKPGDPNILKLLLIYNQERGEDSTGMVIDNHIIKDTEKVMKFLTKNEIVTSPDHENFTFIAHARKSSSGGKFVKELAHPFGMYKDALEKARYDLVLAMNGTLTNTDAMAKEFDVEYKSNVNSDTQTLARIMTKLGEKDYQKALEAYDGPATLLFFTPKYTNTLMVYKDPERPLFYWQKGKNEMYISSMEEPLWAVGAKIEDVNSFDDNKLYRINKGKITKTVTIERKPIKAKTTIYRGYGGGVRYGDITYNNRFSHMGGGCATPFRNTSHNNNNNTTFDIFKPMIESIAKSGKHIYCQVDKYYRNGHPLIDEMQLTKEGEIKINDKDTQGFEKYYFIAGYLVKDEAAFKELKELASDNLKKFSLPKFKDIKLSQLCKYFSHPCISICDNKQLFLLNNYWSEKVTSTGDKLEYVMPFTDIKYTLEYTGRIIQAGDDIVKVCEVVEVKKEVNFVMTPEDYEKGTNLADTIKNIILNNQTLTCGEVYKKITDKRGFDSDKMRLFFYRKLLGLMKDAQIVSNETHDSIFKLGQDCKFNLEAPGDFKGEIEHLLMLYRSHEHRKVDYEKIFAVKEAGSENLNDEETGIIDKQVELEDKTVINSLLKSNPYYIDKNFQEEFYNAEHKDLADYSKQWISDYAKGSAEFRQFCEAILLCLNVIGRISDKEMISMLNMSEVDLNVASDNAYTTYRKQVNKGGVVEYETFTEVEHEENQINAYKDFMAGLEVCIGEVQAVPDNMRTQLVRKLLDFYLNVKIHCVTDQKIEYDN